MRWPSRAGADRQGIRRAPVVGPRRAQSGGADKSSILADSLEALLGAIYLQHGMDVAQDVILRLFNELLDEGWTPGLEDQPAGVGRGRQSRRAVV